MPAISEILKEKAHRYPDKKAFILKDQSITFLELDQNVARAARTLADLGIAKGDKVAFCLPNSFECIYSYLACFVLGAVGVPLDFGLKEDELTSCLSHAEARLLITENKPDVDWTRLRSQTPSLKHLIFTDSTASATASASALMSSSEKKLPDVVIDDNDPALIMYTSGTTGRPKGILLTYKHLEGSPTAMKHFVDLTDADVKLAAIPFSHIGGFIYIQNCIQFAITVVIMPRFNPFEFLENIQRYQITCFHIVPPMYNAILTLKQLDKFDLSSLRWVVVFGAPSSPEILERFHKYCPNAKLLNGWGMTETCPPNTVTPLGHTNIASVGKPSPVCEIQVVDEADAPLAAGGIGEIRIRGWVVMAGYYKDPQATAEVMKNGWLYTGDLGRFDAEGFLYIVGRKKEMIKVGGQLVYAPEVEAAFYKHEAVSEVAVIGKPDRLRGETVLAFVTIKAGHEITPEDLRYFAKEHLAHFKVPQTIELRAELPKNRTGKIDKAQLQKEVLAQA